MEEERSEPLVPREDREEVRRRGCREVVMVCRAAAATVLHPGAFRSPLLRYLGRSVTCWTLRGRLREGRPRF
ncbi:hypothetical protein E2C01_070748 [Portunus trituberculatus]|uniref:Uncharacterized protein n=1 Tax=Portunus trituberculatus TaxID=210409 RepID=A0A5B7I635_PORTR|nr:hypothetical protein [Portunus trituberculatus]